MPTYEYACKDCGESLEVVQSFTDKPLKKCPACSGELRKVFHARGVVFKGSGFYATDSRPAITAESSASSNGSKKEKGDTPKKEAAEKPKTTTPSAKD